MSRIIEDNVVQEVLNYFGTRPYAEVYRIMPVLMNLPALDAPTAPLPHPPVSPPTEVPTGAATDAPTMPPSDSPL